MPLTRILVIGAGALALGAAAAADRVSLTRATGARNNAPAAMTAAPRDTIVRLDSARLARAYVEAARLPRLRSLLVQWRGEVVGER